ncbi:hypothetical protein HMPREF1484_02035 [Dermabacter sp. HFH0086]|nr:hypothetical protein HMPREF1484_02035 [Dermabacter sp. HFH0086]
MDTQFAVDSNVQLLIPKENSSVDGMTIVDRQKVSTGRCLSSETLGGLASWV